MWPISIYFPQVKRNKVKIYFKKTVLFHFICQVVFMTTKLPKLNCTLSLKSLTVFITSFDKQECLSDESLLASHGLYSKYLSGNYKIVQNVWQLDK